MITDPRCKATTPARWYNPTPKPCRLPARRDGYCHKHHPANRSKSGMVDAQLAATKKSLALAEAKAKHWRTRIASLEAEKQRWDAFLANQ